jgi:hypothetical protein
VTIKKEINNGSRNIKYKVKMKFIKIIIAVIAIAIIGTVVFFCCKKEKGDRYNEYKEAIQPNDPIHKELLGWEVITIADQGTKGPECEGPGDGCAPEVTITFICASCQWPGYIPPEGARPVYGEIRKLEDDDTEEERKNRIINNESVFRQILPTELVDGVISGTYITPSIIHQTSDDNTTERFLIQFNDALTNEIVTILPVRTLTEEVGEGQ